MTIRELLESKKYFNIKKKIIKKNIEKELDNKLVDFFIYESNKINEVYINDKSFMSFLDDKIYEFIEKRDYIPDKLYEVIKEDEDINFGNIQHYETHIKLNKRIDCLLNNCLFPKSISKLIINNLDKIINYGLMNIFLEYSDGDCKINSILSNIDNFYDKYLEAIDKYIIRISEDKYNYYRKNIDDSSVFRCDGACFYIYDLIDHIICFFPSTEIIKENNLKIISKYKTRFEKQLFEKINIDDKKIVFLLEKYIFNGIHIDNWFTSDFINIPKEVLDYIFDNFLDIICVNTKDVFIFIENVERIYGSEYSNKIKECLKDSNDYYLNSIVNTVINKNNYNTYIKAKEVVRLIIDDIMNNENVDSYSSIKKIGFGRSSNVYRIGNKVFKIGRSKMRLTANYPNNPYIIKPVMRRIVKFDDEELIFEVQEYVPSYVPTMEERERMYLNERKLGIIWIDPNKASFSKLEKDNKIYWDRELNPSNEALGLTTTVGNDIMLHKGDIVINDADGFYTPNNDRINGIKTRIAISDEVYEFEKKYLKSIK